MNNDIKEIINKYRKFPFFNESRYNAALNGDDLEICNVGTDFACMELYEEAICCWNYIITNGTNKGDAYSNLGVCYYYGNGVEKDCEKAVSYYQRAAASGHSFAQYNLAVACENGNGHPKDLNKAIQFYQKSAEKGVNMAIDALIRLGVYEESKLAYLPRNMNDTSFSSNIFDKEEYNKLLENAHKYESLCREEKGTILGSSFFDNAIKYYLQAIQLFENAPIYYNVANLYKDFGKYEDAIKYYEKSISIEPYDNEAYCNMGVCFYNMLNYEKALYCFDCALQIFPQDYRSLRNKGNALHNLGREEESQICFEEADDLEYRNF